MGFWVLVVMLDLLGIARLEIFSSGRLDLHQAGAGWPLWCRGLAVGDWAVGGRGIVDGGRHCFCWKKKKKKKKKK